MMNSGCIFEFGLRILDLRHAAYFNNGQSDTRRKRLRCASDTTNPKSKIQNLHSKIRYG
jgi:hypothetical protein